MAFDTGANYDPMSNGTYTGVDNMLGGTSPKLQTYYSNQSIGNGATGNAPINMVNKAIYFANGGSAFTTGTGSLIIDISYIVHSGF